MKTEKKSRRQEDDEGNIRQRVREFIDGKLVTLVMTSVTLWALFGDDIRVYATDKPADVYFEVSFVVSLVLFVLELFATSLVVDDYKYSFFFWLDVLAAISLVPDIPYMFNPIIEAFGGAAYTANVTITTSSTDAAQNYASSILKSFRLIRLVRIVKLYKYFTKKESEEQEQRLREAQKQSKTARQAAMNREMDPTRLGKNLSDTTTRRVIIVVLLMIIFLPLMQSEVADYAPTYGLRQLFWFGRSSCKSSSQYECDTEKTNLVSNDGWRDMLYRYSKSSEESEGQDPPSSLLWLYIPNYFENGEMQSIKYIKDNQGNTLWEENSDCADKTVSDDCEFRDSEMLLVVEIPGKCEDEEVKGCSELQSYARFDIKEKTQEQGLMNILNTVFVGLILALASVTFTIDTQKIVIVPITKMVLTIKSLADDPLKKPETQETSDDEEEFGIKESNSMLEKTINKISNMLQHSLGEEGAEILSRNMMSGDGELNLMRPGAKVTLVFSVVKIRNFEAISEILEEDTTRLYNEVCEVVHACCTEWGGLVSSSKQGYINAIWRMPEITDKDTEEDNLNNPAMKRTDIANRALVSMLKVIAELKRSSSVKEFYEDPRIKPLFEDDETKFCIAIHSGWGIEGVIGSEYKINPTYMSPHIQLSLQVVENYKRYKCKILMSEDFYGYLAVSAKEGCRRIDTVYVEYLPNAFGLYTFDLSEKETSAPAGHSLGKLIKLAKLECVNVENFQHRGVEYMFILDSDIKGLQEGISPHLRDTFRHAYVDYISGQWEDANSFLDKTLSYLPDDGPSLAIKDFIKQNNGKPPEEWSRSRELE